MKRILLSIFFLTFFFLNGFSQFCGMSSEELDEFGPWTCPEYRDHIAGIIRGLQPEPKPSPGFPGSTSPIVIEEVVVRRYVSPYLNIFLWQNNTQPNVPFIFVNTPKDGDDNQDPDKIDDREKPCPGDPLSNTHITPSDRAQKNINGGRFGFTRTNADGSKKYHGGVDLFAEPNTPIYPIGEGVVTRVFDGAKPNAYDSANPMGNFVEYQTTINGKTHYVLNGHLNNINGLAVGDPVSPATPIALSGVTGNVLKNPKNPNGYDAIPHLHLEIKDENKKRIDPESVLGTKFDKNGKPTNPCKE